MQKFNVVRLKPVIVSEGESTLEESKVILNRLRALHHGGVYAIMDQNGKIVLEDEK